jgi:hypothetical protein
VNGLGWVKPYVLGGVFAQNVRFGAGYLEAGYDVARPVALARALAHELSWFARAVFCGLFGHGRIVDGGSHCGPDSGREVLVCERCGETLVDHWYY